MYIMSTASSMYIILTASVMNIMPIMTYCVPIPLQIVCKTLVTESGSNSNTNNTESLFHHHSQHISFVKRMGIDSIHSINNGFGIHPICIDSTKEPRYIRFALDLQRKPIPSISFRFTKETPIYLCPHAEIQIPIAQFPVIRATLDAKF